MISILGIIIIPLVSFAAQFAQLPTPNIKKALSEVSPLESVGNVLTPFNDILGKINLESFKGLRNFFSGATDKEPLVEPLKPISDDTLGIKDRLNNTSISAIMGTVKDVFIFAAQIFVVILEILLWIFRGILNLVN